MTENEYHAMQYIRENWERKDRLAIVLIDRGGNAPVKQILRTAEAIASPAHLEWLTSQNEAKKDVYISMSSLKQTATGRTKADIQEVRHVFLDIDERGPETLHKIMHTPDMPVPHHIIESSPERYQVIWSTVGFDVKQAEDLMEGMVRAYEADKVVKDIARILRLPGYLSQKRETPFLVRDIATVASDKREYRPEDFPTFKIEREARTWDAPRVSNAGNGSQSEKDWGWVMRNLERGRQPADLVIELAASRSDKPSPKYYAERTVERAVSKMEFNQTEKLMRRGVGV